MLQSPTSWQQYPNEYKKSLQDPTTFWSQKAEQYVDWYSPWHDVLTGDFKQGTARWFAGATLNVSYNCLDRHLAKQGDKTAIIWQGDDPNDSNTLTYQQLFDAVCKLASGLRELGVKKGDRVCLYLPMIPEAAIAMLACARIGAIHTVVFAGFSSKALRNRIDDAACRWLITADESVRGGKTVPLKTQVDEALSISSTIEKVIVVQRTGADVAMQAGRDITYAEVLSDKPCDPEVMDANDPLFILYTSGSTGKPKGVMHGQGGYLVYASMTFHQLFGQDPDACYWCTADVGWITGHSYIVYGPLSCGATTLMFEGVPSYPDYNRYWQIVERYKVNVFYTAPTAIRALAREGDEYIINHDRSSLRILGTVGEPINPQVWQWYFDVIGEKRCPVIDTWWQTETGGVMLTPQVDMPDKKPGAARRPFFGIAPALLDENANEIEGQGKGQLVISKPWPGLMLGVYGDDTRFVKTYFEPYPGYFYTGDMATRDEQSEYWINGRADDVINVSGHRMSTAEIESALVAHEAIAEAAVVAIHDDISGQAVFAFVTPNVGVKSDEELALVLRDHVKNDLSPIAKPKHILFTAALPKTRSGKIMRRILRCIAQGDTTNLGDTSTLANPEIVEKLIHSRVIF